MTRLTSQGKRIVTEHIVTEATIIIVMNGIRIGTLHYLPGLERELVLGHLLTEGHIHSLTQVKSLLIDCQSTMCHTEIELTAPSPVVGNSTEESLQTVRTEEVFEMAAAAQHLQQLHSLTGATHAAMLRHRLSNTDVFVEDISRSNAIDKVVGQAAVLNIPLHESLLLTSGRVTTETVKKCVNAQVPLLMSLAVATDAAIDIATKSSLTLLGSVSEDGMWLYNEGLIKIQEK